ncbi:HAMP domain-containing sensor histidine kinase [Citricoccus sp. K5]|uniref:sensor histidine kinase n=1 Tax=Citricoccus sp. K5 TaxID=2653135 RepID=UPI0012EEEE1B|nr:HAMP domain-containing sensor histidine kinase [Citricoccus sp. K5]VXA98843.1 Two-component system OmpR family sensor kinase [Citricoccus sp. K5]
MPATVNRAGRFRPFHELARLWKTSSLRTQLVVMTTGLMLLAVIVTAALTASLFRQELVRQIDDDLHANRNNVSVYLTSLGTDTGYFSSPQSILRFYGELQDNAGNTTTNSSFTGANEDRPVVPSLTADEVLERNNEAFDVPGTTETSRGWRVTMYRLASGEGSLAIALPLEPVHDSVDRVTSLVVTIGLLATAGASVIAYAVTTRAFKPLLRVERTAAQIAAGDLSRRVEMGAPDTEVGRLSRSLNAMLAHIETAFRSKEQSEERMRRFIQDASHELRTPLVTIRGFSELYRHGGISDPDDVGAAMGRIEGEAKRMGQLVEDLLTLARLDEQRPLEHRPVDLMLLAHDAVLDARVNAPDREISLEGLDGGRAGSAPTLGDEGKIRQVVTNLVTNALRYSPAGTPLEIAVGTVDVLPGSVHADGRQVHGSRDSVIEIRDHGPGIDEQDASRVFERFYRADSSRQRETGGTGLGLAIVAAIVAQHDGTVRLEQTPGGGATMSVRMPWVDPAADEDDLPQDGEAPDGETESETPGVPEDTSTGPLAIPPRPPQPPGSGPPSTSG